jgi:hypothetical protein
MGKALLVYCAQNMASAEYMKTLKTHLIARGVRAETREIGEKDPNFTTNSINPKDYSMILLGHCMPQLNSAVSAAKIKESPDAKNTEIYAFHDTDDETGFGYDVNLRRIAHRSGFHLIEDLETDHNDLVGKIMMFDDIRFLRGLAERARKEKTGEVYPF